jgi:hypothetical protein
MGALAVTAVPAGVGVGWAHAATVGKDPSGDSGTAPDVVSVKATKVAGGWIRFVTKIANRQSFLPGDTLEIALDTDRNPATGQDVTHSTDPKQQGADYVIFLYNQNNVFHVDGSTLKSGAPASEIGVGAVRGGIKHSAWTLEVKASAIGRPKKLRFWAITYQSSSTAGNVDYAPNAGTYVYPRK